MYQDLNLDTITLVLGDAYIKDSDINSGVDLGLSGAVKSVEAYEKDVVRV